MARMIRHGPEGAVVVGTGAELVLPTLARLRAEVISLLERGGLTGRAGGAEEVEAVHLLSRCGLDYAITAEDEVEIVIEVPPEIGGPLRDYDDPPTQLLMSALYEVCPDLGGDRLVVRDA